VAQAWMLQKRRQIARWMPSVASGELRWAASEALADWLAAYPWHDFVTLTTPPGQGEESLLRLHRKWSGALQREHGKQARQAVFLERAGLLHVHAVTYHTDHIDKYAMETTWERVAGGIARVERMTGGAVEYIVKCVRYASKEGWGPYLVGPWRVRR